MMELKSQLLKSALIFLVCCAGIFVEAGPHKEVKKWKEKIQKHHFLTKCWGMRTMMAFYKASGEFGMECMQLTPAFDIDLFAEPDNEEYNVISDEMENPFFQTPAGMQTLPAQVPFSPIRRVPQSQNPLEAWLAMRAPLYQQVQQQQARSFQYYPARAKRAVDPPTKEELMEFAGKLAEFKNEKKHKMANLTCVLRKFNFLNSNLGINLDHFTKDIWTQIARVEEPDNEFKEHMIKGYNPDNEFKEHMIEGYKQCYQMASSLPADLLAKKGPFYEQFGRQMMFFKCSKMMTDANCVMKELSKWTDYLWGTQSEDKWVKIGLPKDLYKANLMAWTVLAEKETPVQKFVNNFLFGQ